MNIRISRREKEIIDQACADYGVTQRELVKKAVRKFENNYVKDLKVVDYSTYKGAVININFPLHLKKKIRSIIQWYIADQRAKTKPEAPLELEPETVPYIIKEEK